MGANGMKLEITDEKLTSLGDIWVFDINVHKWPNNKDECGDNFGSYCTGFRTAEAYHQAKVDKLMEIIKIQNEFIKSCIYDDTGRCYENADEVSMEAYRVLAETDKMMKELK